MSVGNIEELMVSELKDLYSAEKQITKALPKLIKAATSSELKQALQIDPSLDEARKALASEYLNESKPEESLRTLRSASDTKDTQLILMLASVLLRQGDTAQAQRELHRALAIQPDDPDALQLKQEMLGKSDTPK